MKERIKFTEAEKRAMMEHPDSDRIMVVGEDIDTLMQKENARKFNNQVELFNNEMEQRNESLKKDLKTIEYDINKAEIKPMFSRVLVKPFSQNPFLKMEVSGNLIIDAGGYTPHQEINPVTGRYEELKEFIVSGVIIEIGPDVKYLLEGDVIYYRRDTVVPVPFFKQGLISLAENLVIAVINENLTERFNTVNGK